MNPCDHCSELLLDYLYNLLEAEEAGQVREHLADCSTCRAALAEAESQQGLLARAAQVYRKVPVFTPPLSTAEPQTPLVPAASAPPAAVPAAPPVASTLPLPAQPLRARRLWPWVAGAAAAALLLGTVWLYDQYRIDLGQHEQGLTAARQQVSEVDTRLAKLTSEYEVDRDRLPGRVQAAHPQLDAVGPVAYQPAAPGQYRIQTRSLDGNPAVADVTVRVVDPANGKPLFEQKGLRSRGELAVAVPAGLGVRPGTTARLEIEADTPTAQETLRQDLTVARPEFATYLVLDRAAYRTGELLFFRTLTLERFSLRPPSRPFQLVSTLRDVGGRVLKTLHGRSRPDGIGGGEFALTADLPEGDYTVQVAETSDRFPPQSRPLSIRHVQLAELQFDRLEYLPGDTVHARFRAAASRTVPLPPNQPLAVTLKADDKAVSAASDGRGAAKPLLLQTDKAGNADIKVKLPREVQKALMEVEMHNGNQVRRLTQPIPLAVPRRSVEVFPEGGELVAGLPNRVYFRVQTPPGEAAAFAGRVLDRQGHTVAEVRTAPAGKVTEQHRLGVFEFTPAPGQAYRLAVTAPASLKGEQPLPEVAAAGVVLRVPAGAGREGEPIRPIVYATAASQPLLLLATCRGQVVDQQLLTAKPQGTQVRLTPVSGTRGVVRLTVYEPRAGELVPLAERLVYQAPTERLQLSFALAQGRAEQLARPVESAQLDLKAVTEKGEPANGWLLALVLNDRALHGTAKQTEASLPAFFYLTSAVPQGADLEEADFLLGDSPQAREALDLFLGTAGWRRFVRQPEPLVLVQAGAPQSRGAAAAGTPAIFSRNNRETVKARLDADLARREAALKQEFLAERRTLRDERESRALAVERAVAALAAYEELPLEYLRLGLGILAVLLVAVGTLAMLVGLVKLLRGSTGNSAFAVAVASLVLCATLYGLTGGLRMPNEVGQVADSTKLREPPLPEFVSKERQQPKGKPTTTPTGVFAPVRQAPSAAREAEATADAKAEGQSEKKKADGQAQAGKRAAELAAHSALRRDLRDETEERRAMADDRFQNAQRAQSIVPTPTAGAALHPASPPGVGGVNVGQGTAPPAAKESKGGEQLTLFGASAQVQTMREFAYQRLQAGPRYPDTVLWHPAVEIVNGKAQVSFDLPDTVTTYRVVLYGHSPSGRLGFAQGTLEVRPPQK